MDCSFYIILRLAVLWWGLKCEKPPVCSAVVLFGVFLNQKSKEEKDNSKSLTLNELPVSPFVYDVFTSFLSDIMFHVSQVFSVSDGSGLPAGQFSIWTPLQWSHACMQFSSILLKDANPWLKKTLSRCTSCPLYWHLFNSITSEMQAFFFIAAPITRQINRFRFSSREHGVQFDFPRPRFPLHLSPF